MRILIIKTGALGDVVRTTSVAQGILRKYPNSTITWATCKEMVPLLKLPGIEPVEYERPEWKSQSFDWVLSLEDEDELVQTASSIKCDMLSGATSYGYSSDLAGWFGMGVRHKPLSEANERKRTNTRSFNEIFYDGLDLGRPLLPPKVVAENVDWPTNTIGINTGAGGRWRYKRWTVAKTISLIDRLQDLTPYRITLCGGMEEKARNDLIEEALEDRYPFRPNSLGSLSYFAGVIAKLKVLVTSDSLAMHFALAAGVRTVAFFGPTSDAEIELFGLGEKVITPLGCRCCYLKDCSIRPTCMDSISVEQMTATVMRNLR